MRIENGQQLLQHIDAGSTFALNRNGQLETQSGVSRFFQSIGDAFRRLTASGRASIAARAERLQGAMAELISRDNALPNLARGGQAGQPSPVARNALAARMEVAGRLAALPAEARPGAARLVHDILRAQDRLEGTPQEARAAARQVMNHIIGHPVLLEALGRAGAAATPEGLRVMADRLTANLRETFVKPSQQALIHDHIHEDFIKDANRGSVRFVNDQPVVDRQAPLGGDWKGLLEALVPQPAIRAFVSMATSQAGLEASVWQQVMSSDGAHPSGMPGVIDMIGAGVKESVPLHKYDLAVRDHTLDIHLTYETRYDLINDGSDPIAQGQAAFARHTYEATLSLPLDQDMTGKDVPDFTVVDLRMTPQI